MKYILIVFLLFYVPLKAACELPKDIKLLSKDISIESLQNHTKDTKRNFETLKSLCVHQVSFKEKKYHWQMLLVTNPDAPKGPFWFLPHDDENTAFDTAVYATKKYGGGFLAVLSGDKRYFHGQDPNRNFGTSNKTAKTCKKQKYPAPKYSNIIFAIINNFRAKGMPYLALHNNKDGWYKNGGTGGVSVLNSSSTVQSYQASKYINTKTTGLEDEDSLVYIAGLEKRPNPNKLKQILNLGINVKYEVIDASSNDCSLSNYVVLNIGVNDYFNLEVEHGDLATHKAMVDKIISIVN